MKNLLTKRVAVLMLVAAMLVTTAAGCSNKASGETKQSETGSTAGTETQGQSDETQPATEAKTENDPIDPDAIALKVGDTEITAAEMFYYYYAGKLQNESAGLTDWSMEYSQGVTMGDKLKEQIEMMMLQIAYSDTLVPDQEINLSDDDMENVENGVTSFFANIPEEDVSFYGFNEENIKAAFEHSMMYSKRVTAEVDRLVSELTEEEKADCVYRTVQHILFLTEAPAQTNESGESETASEADAASYKEAQKAKAEEVLARAQAGEDFQTLADEFNEDNGFEYSFNKNGQTIDGTSFVQEFVDGGNALKEGEMAIVETQYGYHIVKCISENSAELQNEAEENLALNKINAAYQEWIEANSPEFYDVWKNFAVLNPVVNTDESETGDTEDTNESATGETAGTDETPAATESGSSDDNGADETQSSETNTTDETQS